MREDITREINYKTLMSHDGDRLLFNKPRLTFMLNQRR